jgi:hypothetical protein
MTALKNISATNAEYMCEDDPVSKPGNDHILSEDIPIPTTIGIVQELREHS